MDVSIDESSLAVSPHAVSLEKGVSCSVRSQVQVVQYDVTASSECGRVGAQPDLDLFRATTGSARSGGDGRAANARARECFFQSLELVRLEPPGAGGDDGSATAPVDYLLQARQTSLVKRFCVSSIDRVQHTVDIEENHRRGGISTPNYRCPPFAFALPPALFGHFNVPMPTPTPWNGWDGMGGIGWMG